MGDTSGNQGMPGGMNFGDIRRRLQQMQGGGVPAPPQGQPNPAPPAPPQKTAAPGADGAGMTAQAPATQPIGGSVQVGKPQNPYLPPGGTGPKDQQGGDPTARRAVGPPQTGAPAVSPGAPIGPGAPPPQPRRALGTESRGGQMPSPGNPSPGGPRGQNGTMPPRRAVGAPQAGGWQPPSWGTPGSDSAGMPNTPAPQPQPGPQPGPRPQAYAGSGLPGLSAPQPQPAPGNPYANMTQQQKDEVLRGMKPNPAIQKIDPSTGKPYTASQLPGMSPGGESGFSNPWASPKPVDTGKPAGGSWDPEKGPNPEMWQGGGAVPPGGKLRYLGGGGANPGFDGQRRPIGPGGQGGGTSQTMDYRPGRDYQPGPDGFPMRPGQGGQGGPSGGGPSV